MKKWFIFFCLLVFLCSRSSAEDLGRITLKQAIDLARQKNFTLQAVQAQLEEARAGVRISKSGYFPQLSASGSIQRIFPDTKKIIISGGELGKQDQDFTRQSVNLRLSQNIFDFGKRYHKLQQSRSKQQAAVDNLAAIKARVIFEVKRAFYGYFQSLNLLDAATESVRQFEMQLQQAGARNQAGLAPMIDVTTARMNLASARSKWQQAQAEVTLAKAALSKAIGLDLADEYQPVRPVETAGSVPVLEELMERLMKHNPSIRQAQERVRGAEFALNAARSEYWPSLFAQVDYLAKNDDYGHDSSWEKSLSLGLRLDVPLFSGGSRYYGVKSARSELQHRRAVLKQTIEDAKLTLIEDFTNYKKTLSQLTSLKEAGQAAEANLEMASSRYQLGLGDIIEWTEASLNLIVNKTDYINANYSLFITMARLKKDIGEL